MLLLILAVNITSCTEETLDNPATENPTGEEPINSGPGLVSAINFSTDSLYMLKGATRQIEFDVDPDDVENDSLVWTSSNEGAVQVNQAGMLSAVDYGTTVITARATDGSNVAARCTVIVSQPILINSITLSASTLSLYNGKNSSLGVTINPSHVTNDSLTWTSSNTSVATVANGVVSAVGLGLTTITVSATDGSGVSATCNVTVEAINLATTANITQSEGWFESAYVEWTGPSNASTFNVYYSGMGVTDKKIDNQLIRSYGSYYRADILGMAAGSYTIKVLPVIEGSEGTSPSTASVTVKAHDRSGFAHFNHTGVGAYNDDGTLKSNAQVIYVTAKTAKTVTCTVGGTTFTGLQAIIDAYSKSTSNTPISIRIVGKIEAADMDKFSSSAEGLQIKGKSAHSLMNITLEGVGKDAVIRGFGILMRNCKSVEVRNFAIMLCMDDCISLDTDNSNCWIHNIDFFYGKTGSAADQAKGDGSLDCKGDSKYLTFSYNHFWDSGKMSLCGMTSESGENFISYHHNWFDHSDSRHPRVRTMTVHVYNNYFDGIAKYGVGATTGSNVFVESNYFRNVNKPMMISLQGTDISNGVNNGTFSGESGGMIKAYGNYYAEKSGNFKLVPHTTSPTSFDCYEATTRTEQVPSSYKTLVGSSTYNNFDTDNSKMYSYTADAAESVPGIIKGVFGAGRMQQGDFAWAFNNAVDDAADAVNTALKTAITNYTSSLVSIQNEGSGNSSGSDGGGDTGGGETGGTTIEGSVACHFTGKTPSNSSFAVVGSYSTDKGSVTVNGTTYGTCVKMESSTSITFSITSPMTLTLVFGGTTAANGKKVKVNDGSHTVDANQELVLPLTAGSHTIKKGDSINLFYISLN